MAKPKSIKLPGSEQSRRLVAGARSRLAELEVEFAREKSRVDAVQAVLFRHLRRHYLKRDRLRLAVHYRQVFLDSFVRDNTDEAEQAENDLRQAKGQLDKDYAETLAAAGKKKPLTVKQEAELTRIWKKLVKLYRPDRFTREPVKRETYHKLAAAIHQAKGSGDIGTLRKIAADPQGFMLRHGWAKLDFGDPEKLMPLKRLHETLQEEIASVTESLEELRASPDYELCRLAEPKSGKLNKLAAKRASRLQVKNRELELHAERLAKEIKRLSGKPAQ
jgi:hypothetical protein